MMKKFMIALAALSIVMSCNTEKLTQDIPAEENDGKVVTLTANLPELTKATVDATTFSWVGGDKIAIPSTASTGYAIFTNSAANLNTFTCTLGEGERLISGKAIYPAVAPGSAFDSIDEAKQSFQMEADYTVGDNSISFAHKSALVKVSFSNVPSFATGLKVTEGDAVVATIDNVESTDGNTVDFFVPLTPNGSKKYTFALMENNHVVKSAAKTIELSAGYYYATPVIAVNYIKVGVRDYIYNEWNLKTGWKIHYWTSSTVGDVELVSLGKTEEKSIPNYYSPGTFYLYYSVSVPTDFDGLKVWCDNGTNDNWFGGDAPSSTTKVYVFEWDFGNQKLAYYE